MPARSRLLGLLPWLLCAASLLLLALGNLLRWLGRDQEPAEHVGWTQGVIAALGMAGVPVVGALIATRLPANRYGWLWCAIGLVYALALSARPVGNAVHVHPWVPSLVESLSYCAVLSLLTFVFLWFPTGRLPSLRWRWLARAAVAVPSLLALSVPFVPNPADPAQSSPWALPGAAGSTLGVTAEIGLGVMLVLGLAAVLSLISRYRQAGPVERRQLEWFLYAAVLGGVLRVLDALGLVTTGLFAEVLQALAFALLPTAVAIAVLRYRLYEIDRIVSRTVTYGLLTVGISAVYLLAVAGLPQLGLAGSSDLVVAGVTLVVAALVGRVRRRLQAAVDRRFDRARYDAARAVDAFTRRLRDQVDLDEIAADLRGTVAATVAPTHVGLWLSVRSRQGGA